MSTFNPYSEKRFKDLPSSDLSNEPDDSMPSQEEAPLPDSVATEEEDQQEELFYRIDGYEMM